MHQATLWRALSNLSDAFMASGGPARELQPVRGAKVPRRRNGAATTAFVSRRIGGLTIAPVRYLSHS